MNFIDTAMLDLIDRVDRVRARIASRQRWQDEADMWMLVTRARRDPVRFLHRALFHVAGDATNGIFTDCIIRLSAPGQGVSCAGYLD